jgi:hypothetical protein
MTSSVFHSYFHAYEVGKFYRVPCVKTDEALLGYGWLRCADHRSRACGRASSSISLGQPLAHRLALCDQRKSEPCCNWYRSPAFVARLRRGDPTRKVPHITSVHRGRRRHEAHEVQARAAAVSVQARRSGCRSSRRAFASAAHDRHGLPAQGPAAGGLPLDGDVVSAQVTACAGTSRPASLSPRRVPQGNARDLRHEVPRPRPHVPVGLRTAAGRVQRSRRQVGPGHSDRHRGLLRRA